MLTENSIADFGTNPQVEYDNKNYDVIIQKIPHTDGLKVLEIAFKYIEQQAEPTVHDLLSLRCWQSLAIKKECKTLTENR